ncbi:MAG: hypothetical protein QGG42_00750 [Phycisphaerae bacterium]|jgi:hypothetical protein|nr:hypothetical protein [Phycisphaerae bacterium]
MKHAVSRTPGTLRLFGTILLVAVAVSGPLSACSVPVFRYALQRWQPNSHLAVIFHRGKLSAKQAAVCKGLSVNAQNANLTVQTVDLNEDLSPWAPEFYTSGDLPRMVLLKPPRGNGSSSPKSWGAGHMVWSAPVNKASAAMVTDSPKRREIARLIRSGQSVVWVLLDSGDAKKDAAAATLTKRVLTKLAGKLKIVRPLLTDAKRAKSKLAKLRLAFSTIIVSRADRSERVLVELLLSSDKGLRDAKGPVLFPVIGRGRVMGSLVDKGITEENIAQFAAALTGPCSCALKARSVSALDLLISTDWTTAAKAKPTTRPAATTRPSPKSARGSVRRRGGGDDVVE